MAPQLLLIFEFRGNEGFQPRSLHVYLQRREAYLQDLGLWSSPNMHVVPSLWSCMLFHFHTITPVFRTSYNTALTTF
jgi:hypothetical protein